MAALPEVQKAQMLGMTAVASKSFVVEHSKQSRARYQANCKAVFAYVEAMAERNELYDEAEHRSHINAMVRLMRVGICRSKYWTESRKDYDWHAVLQADKAVAAAAATPEATPETRCKSMQARWMPFPMVTGRIMTC